MQTVRARHRDSTQRKELQVLDLEDVSKLVGSQALTILQLQAENAKLKVKLEKYEQNGSGPIPDEVAESAV
jgi:hypothetical protein